MNAPGVLLDTGPLVALLSASDANHARARGLFAACAPPLRCCEAVLAEACFLMRKVHPAGPAEVITLGRRGVYEIGMAVAEHWTQIEALLRSTPTSRSHSPMRASSDAPKSTRKPECSRSTATSASTGGGATGNSTSCSDVVPDSKTLQHVRIAAEHELEGADLLRLIRQGHSQRHAFAVGGSRVDRGMLIGRLSVTDRAAVLAHEDPVTLKVPPSATGIGACIVPCAQSNSSAPWAASRTIPTWSPPHSPCGTSPLGRLMPPQPVNTSGKRQRQVRCDGCDGRIATYWHNHG